MSIRFDNRVAVVTSPSQYGALTDELRRSGGELSDETRARLASAAFWWRIWRGSSSRRDGPSRPGGECTTIFQRRRKRQRLHLQLSL